MTTRITDGFWRDRLDVNARRAIFHQWDQLEASGCIENFRIAAGDVDGFRTGWFFADSDAHKWLDAASRIFASFPDLELADVMDAFIALLARAQQPDGYLFTYNQIHFPGTRWTNLQIEHELYCHGYLIEAGVSHHTATGRTDLLKIARRAANRIVDDFRGRGPSRTPGHEEIEIALLRLYQVTKHAPYLEMARQFIEQRGRDPFFALSLLKQNSSVEARGKFVKQKRREYLTAHPEFKPFQIPPGNAAQKPWNATLRWTISALSGKYFQQHAPVRKQTVPVGHSVRFAYLETAIAMLARETGDAIFVPALERAWEHMVSRRMYVTGGIGSLPALEGFGNDYELDPEYAYAETCAALASLFWNWEMAQLTGKAKYSDLFEWQLYNAAAVGMGLDGATYLYNNPLTCRGGVTRKPWYAVPCCPSNLSRTWADLRKYIYSTSKGEARVHQYINSELDTEIVQLEDGTTAAINIMMETDLPWGRTAELKITPFSVDPLPDSPYTEPVEFTLHLRVPSWADLAYSVNEEKQQGTIKVVNAGDPEEPLPFEVAAGGFDPRFAKWVSIKRAWKQGDVVHLYFVYNFAFRKASPRVRGHQGKIALTYGPIVYCLESVDNPDVDIFSAQLGNKFELEYLPFPPLGEHAHVILAHTPEGKQLTFIPYHLWGNRGASTMTVWVNA
jgi:DUF1680 family protein